MSLEYDYKWCGGTQRMQAPRYLHNVQVDGETVTHIHTHCSRCGRTENFTRNKVNKLPYRMWFYRDTLQSASEPELFIREYGGVYDPYTGVHEQRDIQKKQARKKAGG